MIARLSLGQSFSVTALLKKKQPVAKPQALPVPRLGPPTNVRPGGPHEDSAEKKREQAIREALRRGDVDADAL